MGRLLLLAAIIAIVYLLIRAFRSKPPSTPDTPVAEDMVRCERCGVHLPRSESVESGGRFYCCIEHRDADN
ncbi:MAG TPA: PP0621 family protein [Gallionella sp.]